jgi:uncharacterized protein
VRGVTGALLFVTQVAPYADGPAGVHGVLDQAAVGVAQIAEMHDLAPQRVDDVRALDTAALGRTRVLALFTIGETPWDAAQRAQIAERVRAGDLAILSIHSATDSCYGWPEYGALVGARFDGHPWTQTFAIRRCGEPHPSTARLPDPWRFTDEVYLFRDLRDDARVLLEAVGDDLDLDAPGARRPAHGFPLAWCFTEGRGRVFYTALGHFPGAYEDVRFLAHLHGGLAWLADRGRPE